MAHFASPFCQTILSLTDHCLPSPNFTTHQADFVDPQVRRYESLEPHDDKLTQHLLRYLGLDKYYGEIPMNARYCNTQTNQTGSNQLGRKCEKRITIYMLSYSRPDERVKRFKFFKASKSASDKEKAQQFIENEKANANKSVTCTAPPQKAKVDKEQLFTQAASKKGQKIIIPQWKIDGWNAKKRCWARPLEERKNYYATLDYRNPKNKCKCCIQS